MVDSDWDQKVKGSNPWLHQIDVEYLGEVLCMDFIRYKMSTRLSWAVKDRVSVLERSACQMAATR